MKVFYLDPGLCIRAGHHPAHCRLIAGEFRSRGFETRVFGHMDIDPRLGVELRAQPLFRHWTYVQSDGDPLCGWLSGFDTFVQWTLEDLTRLGEIGPTDLLYLSSARPIELAAIVGWMARHAPEAMPSVVVDFCAAPGVDFDSTEADAKIIMPDPRQDASPLLLRFVSKRMPPHILQHLRLVTFEPALTSHYRQLLGRRVDTLPRLFEATTGRRNRVGTRPLVVALLGQQQRAKGYHMAPEIVRLLLIQRPELQFQIHNADPAATNANDPTGLVEAQELLRQIAASDRRVKLSEGPVDQDHWSSLLERSDVVLCPYAPEPYRACFSAVAVEAIANGIPIVGPADTAVETLIREFGGAGVVFERQEPNPIVAATVKLLDDFDRCAALAHEAAMIWPTRYGAHAMVDALLALLAR